MHYKYLPLLTFFLFCISCQNTTSTPPTKGKVAEATETRPPPSGSKETGNREKKVVLFFGNSLTAGLGVDPQDAFVGLLGKKMEGLGMPYTAINSGVSGETTAGGLGRINWILEQYEPAVFVLELGGNDALRGVDPAASHKNLQGIIDEVKKKYPKTPIVLAGMEAPPNMGEVFRNSFRKVYKDLAQNNDLLLIPFLLDGVGGVADLNQKDGIHPTEEGHKVVAEVIWKTLKKAL
ncbi:MAG: acyl-CoA thioesterase-1 [Polaribacter sp.]|jgi:acyl-CoA thioesterase-1